MGMRDDVICNNELFGDRKGDTCGTQDLDPVFPGSTYEITASGRLELLECTYEDHGDPNATGLARLFGAMTPAFTGGRRDLNYHGWLVLEPLGRAKFTDGTLVEFEPYSNQSRSQNPSQAKAAQVAPREGAPSEPESQRTAGPAEYLRHFFTELEKLKRPASAGVSHAIGFRDGQLCALASIGEFRERVHVEDLDEDPQRAAQEVFQLWQAKLHLDEDIE